jgi:hypothetical protein
MKNSKTFKLIFLGFAYLSMFSCAPELNPSKPILTPADPPEVPASHVNISIEMDSKPVLNAITNGLTFNKSAGRYNEWFGTRGRDSGPGGISAGYEAYTKAEEINPVFNNTNLTTSFLLYYWIDARVYPLPPATTVSCGTNGEPIRTLRVNLTADYDLTDDWNLNIKTTPSIAFTDRPCLFGLVHYNATPKLKAAIEPKIIDEAKKFDAGFTAQVAMRDKVQTVWTKMHEPQKIANNTYLLMNTSNIYVHPILADAQRMKVGVQIEARPTITFGNTQAAAAPPLPAKGIAPASNSFKLFLPIQVKYDAVKKELHDAFKIDGSDNLLRFPRTGKKFFFVKNIDIESYNNEVVFRLDVDGKVTGHIYLSGMPRYDAATKEIFFDNVTLSTASEKWIHDKALWLLSEIPGLTDYISRKSRTNISVPIDDVKTKIDDYLRSTVAVGASQIKLNGNLNTLDLKSVFADNKNEMINFYFHASGDLSGILQ